MDKEIKIPRLDTKDKNVRCNVIVMKTPEDYY